jgi:hypothetical protein
VKIGLEREEVCVHVQYVRRVDRVWAVARRHGFDALIVIGALEGALEVALGHAAGRELSTSRWFAVPATACVLLVLLGRRRFPFAAPAAMWLLAAALSSLEGWLVVSLSSLYIAGLVASLLLGNVGDVVRARVGLAVALCATTIVVANDPSHTAGEFVFIPA